ncbi:DUF3087 domain-containing protein [Stutzerimonas urumqiensis]|uniref:DUF3087 domain-containing protein n=1 Tax=Stutzerimonas urumqiensis TaxID=638269 RepID=UPI000EAE96E0|nr:DUF3087 domain-containing protein [Stutzerimonas urumqiensis]
MFELRPLDPERYRRDTRRIAFVLIAVFLVLAMLLSTLAVRLFGEPGGDNFRWNLIGVLAGLAATAVVVRLKLWSTPWMAPAVYGWQLKRNLMRVTNVMHGVKAGVAARDADALKLLRFYHLGVMQMHQLDGNPADSALVREIDAHQALMDAQGIAPQQTRLDPEWLDAVRRHLPSGR